jgi:predicted O-linked N-acetylglucosamine transferase (SPINDLY family)
MRVINIMRAINYALCPRSGKNERNNFTAPATMTSPEDLLAQGQYAAAAAAYEAAIAADSPIAAGSPERIARLFAEASQLHQVSQYPAAIALAKRCVQLAPDDRQVLAQAVFLMQSGDTASLRESLPLAKQLLELSSSLVEQITVTHYILTSLLMTGGSSEEAIAYYQKHKELLLKVANDQGSSTDLKSPELIHRVMSMGIFFNYFEDNPKVNRPIRNRVALAGQQDLQALMSDRVERYRQNQANRKLAKLPSSKPLASKSLKIGYLSDCLRLHSVGWLVRWLLAYHDRDRFEIHLYSTRRSDDPLQQGFIQHYGDRFHHLPNSAGEIADQIDRDEIDILVDLDSITAFGNCAATALKPAPVQVSWLGYDAIGLPAIDYYIADPFVLPKTAQDYYCEKIWRLPQTYIAVDGFEVGTPSLRRDQLGIPAEAIVYLSSQTGLKRNPDNVRLQLQILKAVPNSYFLIKSFASDRAQLAEFFAQIAAEVGVSDDRLRFLPDVPANETHRANLALADVILDTYPYNGATTTLEALWMQLPIVTRVGEQFAARNSYTLMMNAGIMEGIAWTNAEYLDWGVRLGQDAALRAQIAQQLKRSRQTAPLWNAAAFAREMEQAYEQMWEQRWQEKG